MDKETLSNYGWIVICVLVLAVMIALASPFGSYVASAVENTTQGLFDVEQGALSAAGIDIADQSFDGGELSENNGLVLEAGAAIPEGGTYYVGVTSTENGDYTGATATYTASQTMPSIVSDGDVYVYGDYEYRYNKLWDMGWHYSSSQNGWSVKVLNTTKTEYGAILESINGQPVTNMNNTFIYTTLETAPTIPSGVTHMWATFQGCTSLETAPVIPSSVTDMDSTFQGCSSLTGDIEINATPTNYYDCLSGTQITSISGDCTIKDKLLATK